MEEPQKPRKKRILVIGRDALEHFETLRKAICDRGFQLLIHPSRVGSVQELNSEELNHSDVVIVNHDREEGAEGSEDLLRVVATLRTIRVGLAVIVLGVYGYKLRNKLRKHATLVDKRDLGKVSPEELEKTLRELGIGRAVVKAEQPASPPES